MVSLRSTPPVQNLLLGLDSGHLVSGFPVVLGPDVLFFFAGFFINKRKRTKKGVRVYL